MEAMKYEYIIRKAYGIGRDYSKGADADIYRKFERVERGLMLDKEAIAKKEMRVTGGSLQDQEYEVRVAAAKVTNHLQAALMHVIQRFGFEEIPSDPIKKLQACQSKLNTQYDKTVIDGAMDEIHEVFTELGLQMR